MKTKSLFLAILLGLSTPIISNFSNNYIVNAQEEENAPIGIFKNNNLSVSLWYENNAYHYFSYNPSSRDYIQLSGARLSGESNAQRKIFVWYNGNYEYQIAWRPSEPNFVRVIIINSRNEIVTNSILTRQNSYY